jgi:phage terminase large subunit-like protein
MGSLNYAREMLLQRVDPATQPFKSQYETLYQEAPQRFQYIVTVCDPAYSENQGDYSAIVTIGLTGGNHAYVLESKAIRREDPGEVVKELVRTIRVWNPTVVGIEKRKGDAISYSFREARTRLNLWDFKYVELQSHGVSKEKRINMVGGLVSRWESRSVHIHAEMKQLREQLYAYRFDDSSKEHDDLVDALAYCFHPDMVKPNSGASSVPKDMEEASMEGRPRYQVGQGEGWMPTESLRWSLRGTNFGSRLARRIDQRVGEAA